MSTEPYLDDVTVILEFSIYVFKTIVICNVKTL